MNRLFSNVLVINLDKDTDRWEQCKSELTNLRLVPMRIPAIYGASMDTKDYRKNTSFLCNKFCTPSMVGCWLSHKRCWNYILNNNIESAMIIEDDCQFVPDFEKKLLEYTRELPENWDIILLGTLLECKGEKCGTFAKLANALRRFISFGNGDQKITENLYKVDSFLGTHSYIVNRRGAKKLLESLNQADGHLDHGISRHLDYINGYAVTPSIAYQRASAGQSTQTASFPKTLNPMLDKVSEDNVSLGFMISEPIANINGYIVNGWSFLFILLGILMTVKKVKVLALAIVIILLGLELYVKWDGKTFRQVIGSLICVGLGYFTARTFSK